MRIEMKRILLDLDDCIHGAKEMQKEYLKVSKSSFGDVEELRTCRRNLFDKISSLTVLTNMLYWDNYDYFVEERKDLERIIEDCKHE